LRHRSSIAALIAALAIGCATHIGPETVLPDGTVECHGITIAIGDAASCGTKGGKLSAEFTGLIRWVAILARSLMPGGFVPLPEESP
jgi:hypothetical protein